MKKINKDEVIEFLSKCSSETKMYVGCDSTRYRVRGEWFAEYTTVLVVHIDGCKGCRIFGQMDKERDYDNIAKKPSLRLMNEVYRCAALFLDLKEILTNYEVEVHLDINPNLNYGSSCVISQATGYIKGMCNVIPLCKPNAFAASYAADRLKSISGL